MESNGLGKVIGDMVIASSRANPPADDDYPGEDGLLYCGKCHTPKQCRVTMLEKEYTPFIQCKCKQEAIDRENREREEAEQSYLREIRRQKAFTSDKSRNFTFDADNGRDPEASRIARTYADEFDKTGKNFILNGNPGLGKSFLACCIVNAAIDRGLTARFTNVSEIERELWNAENKNAIYDDLTRLDLLVLDDFGVERQSEYMKQITFNIIDARYQAGKPLMITTNIKNSQLAAAKEAEDIEKSRIFGRLLENAAAYTMKGRDYRFESAGRTAAGS